MIWSPIVITGICVGAVALLLLLLLIARRLSRPHAKSLTPSIEAETYAAPAPPPPNVTTIDTVNHARPSSPIDYRRRENITPSVRSSAFTIAPIPDHLIPPRTSSSADDGKNDDGDPGKKKKRDQVVLMPQFSGTMKAVESFRRRGGDEINLKVGVGFDC